MVEKLTILAHKRKKVYALNIGKKFWGQQPDIIWAGITITVHPGRMNVSTPQTRIEALW